MIKRRSFLAATATSAIGVFASQDLFFMNTSYFSRKVFKAHFGSIAKLVDVVKYKDGKTIKATCIVNSTESFLAKIGDFSDKNSKIFANGNTLQFHRAKEVIDLKLVIQHKV